MDGWEDSSSSSSSRWKDSKSAGALRAAGSSLADSGRSEMASASSERFTPVSYKKGGRVKRTGLARVHKGEYVVPRGKVKRVKKALRSRGRR